MKKLLAMALVGLVGCGMGAVEAGEEPGSVEADVRSSLPKVGAPEPRVYWNASSLDFGAGGRGPYYRSFDAQGGAPFTVSVTNYDDGGEPDSVPFHLKLYYASGNRWRLYASADSQSSTATITANPRYGHSWLVVLRADADFWVLQSYLTCGADRSSCEVALQPNDSCDGSVACDTGLFCDNGPGCGATGSCHEVTYLCSQKTGPVCGCDGQDYASGCDAAQASVGVAFNGSCANPPAPGCDPNATWVNEYVGLVGIEKLSTWTTSDGALSYTFGTDGSVRISDGSSGTASVDASDAQMLDVTLADGNVRGFREQVNCNSELKLVAQWKGSNGLTLFPPAGGRTTPSK